MVNIIEFEGIDKSGKETQSAMAVQWFHEMGFGVNHDKTISFPDYDTYTGNIIRQCLDTGIPYHPVKNANEFQAIMILNRYEKQPHFTNYIQNKRTVICDRYMTSMLVYGKLSGVDDKWNLDAQHRLYKPNLSIIMDISIEEYKKRSSSFNLDIYEKDTSFIEKVKQAYLDVKLPWDKIVVNGEGSKEEVHKRVKQAIIQYLRVHS